MLELQKLALNKGFSLDIQSNKELAVSLEKATDKNDSSINQVKMYYFIWKSLTNIKYFIVYLFCIYSSGSMYFLIGKYIILWKDLIIVLQMVFIICTKLSKRKVKVMVLTYKVNK